MGNVSSHTMIPTAQRVQAQKAKVQMFQVEDLKKLVTTVPEEVVFHGISYNPNIRDAGATWMKHGALDVEKLLLDGKIKLNDTPITTQWHKHEYQNAIICG